jgi:Flp pilus assembly protein TadD
MVEFGDTLVEAGSSDDAITIYSRIGTKSSARLGALLGLTRVYLGLDDPAKALDYADEALKLEPHDTRVLVDRGVALDSLGRHGEAQECYRAVLGVTPRNVSARNNLALSLALTGNYDEAIALIAPLVRSSSVTPRERENMAVIYGLMGDAGRAAALSRMDLDEGTTQANLGFLAAVRGTKP